MSKRKKYALYLRKSRTDLELESFGEMETLARHEGILRELAKRKGITDLVVYKELVSGESLQARPEMRRLLKAVYENQYEGVLVVELERLARGDTKDQGEIMEAFKYSDTKIITPVKDYDPSNEFDEEYLEFGLFMSRREYKAITRRMHQGVILSIKEGNYIGSVPPYGYDIWNRGKRDRTLKMNDNAQYVRMMFDWFVNERLTPGAIARRLTDMGVLTSTKKKEWHRGTVRDILTNIVYAGKIEWYKRKNSKEFTDDGLTVMNRRQKAVDRLLVEGKHDGIIDLDTFNKAQTLFPGSVPVKASTTVSNPLAGLVACKNCGKILRRNGFDKQPSVVPRLIHQPSKLCKMKSAPFDEVMDLIIENLKEHIEDFQLKMSSDAERIQAEKHRIMIESMEEELKSLGEQRTKLFDYLEREIYTEDEFLERKATINERIKELSETIDKERKPVTVDVDYHEKIVKFSDVIESLKNPKIPAKNKNDLLKDIIERIEYNCIDLGRQKGGIVELDVFLKD